MTVGAAAVLCGSPTPVGSPVRGADLLIHKKQAHFSLSKRFVDIG